MTLSGSGTESDPWKITSVADLTELSGNGYASYAGADKYFEITQDIDFAGGNFTPIGNSTYPFIAHFDGKNHTIKNMKIDTTESYTGLFSHASGSCQISNIKFDSCINIGDAAESSILIGHLTEFDNTSISNIDFYNCSFDKAERNDIGFLISFITDYEETTSILNVDKCNIYNCSIYADLCEDVGGLLGDIGCKKCTIVITECNVDRLMVNNAIDFGAIISNMADSTGYTPSSDCEIIRCKVTNSVFDEISYSSIAICGFRGSTLLIDDCVVDNVCLIGRYNSGLIGGVYTKTSTIIDNPIITNCTIAEDGDSIGGVIGDISSGGTTSVINPIIKNNNIQTTSGRCGGISGNTSTKLTVTGGVQDYNNMYGTLTGGTNVTGYTNQTSVKNQYITAESLTATTNGMDVTYTIHGQRGAAISYNETTYAIEGGKDWDYKNDGTIITDYSNEHTFTESGSYLSKVHLYNPSNTSGIWLQLGTPVTPSPPTPTPTVSIGDTTFRDKSAEWCQSMPSITNHDMSMLKE